MALCLKGVEEASQSSRKYTCRRRDAVVAAADALKGFSRNITGRSLQQQGQDLTVA